MAYGYRLDIGAVLSEGWRLFTLDIGGFIGFAFVGGVIAVLLALTIVGFLLYLPLLAGLWIVPLLMLKGRPHGFNDFFGGFKKLGQLVLLGLVMGLLVLLGTIAFIIPGVYLGIAWTWALGLVLDRGMGFWEAMSPYGKCSRRWTSRSWHWAREPQSDRVSTCTARHEVTS